MKPASLDLISAQETSSRLGISRASLYAYVSRGLIRSFASPHDPRQRLYALDDVEALVKRRTQFRRPTAAAATALDWGLPVLETALTQIKDGHLLYRGVDAVDLAETAPLEDAACLLIGDIAADAFALPSPPISPLAGPALGSQGFVSQAIHLLSEQASENRQHPNREIATILRLMAAAGSGADPGIMPLHRHLASSWNVSAEAADAIRRALVLCADHELSASAFAVRVAASTGASLRNAVIAGLAALSGPLHGGATDHMRAFLEECDDRGGRAPSQSKAFPSFHHPLYPEGDPRGATLVKDLPLRAIDAAILRESEHAGEGPTVDAGLVMMERAYDLPRGAAFALFAIGRTAGWLAHAVEQRQQATLIRPRARYVVAQDKAFP
ncbi:citrate synthase [Microvirga alba]|uniref:citrate synthase (unknown stereospecificity) n=1 Tax=Microvirga alba TaxID=2791025 RepID=A0A931BQI7_9HYPH|nr:citrate synthase [Microvirga alba]MBF9231880.1 citrate synthase family protein [Microvirga alba]